MIPTDAVWPLTAAVFLPLLGAGILAVFPSDEDRDVIKASIVFSAISFAMVAWIAASFDYGNSGELQFVVEVPWIDAIGAKYFLAIDGISLPLVFLTHLLTLLCAIYALFHMPEPGKPKAFLSLMLVLQVGMAGSFLAHDLILFFIFWEVVLVPMYFMIGMWGGPRREYASIKFFLYTLFGSVFMLIGFLAIYFQAGATTWDIQELSAMALGTESFQTWAFAGLFLGFAIKVPVWPFHTWLPDAHTEAPTIGSVLLAGVLLKMGTYGMIRIALPILPEGAVNFAPWIGVLAVIGIIYGSLCCLAQTDVKRMIAFSSVGHMGFTMLGIASLNEQGIQAALYGNIAHGVVTGSLFFLAGSMHERFHSRDIATIGGGMLTTMPKYGVMLTFVAVASLGLPGLAGFWGEFGAMWSAISPGQGLEASYDTFYLYLVVGAAVGTVLTAGYFLWLLQRINLGTPRDKWAQAELQDIQPLEWAAWSPLFVLVLLMGVLPVIVFGPQDAAVVRLLGFFA